MSRDPLTGILRGILAAILVLSVLPRTCPAEETNQLPLVTRTDETNSQEILRVYLQLQEQVHAAQLAIEQNRKEARESAAQNAELLTDRLRAIEQALAAQRARELEAMQSSNRVMLIVAGSFACVGFLVMLAGAYFQWRTAQSLTGLSAGRALASSPNFAALGPGEGPLVTVGPVEQSNLRLLGALEQLEKRIHELEHTTRVPLKAGSPPAPSGGSPAVFSNGDSGMHAEENGGDPSAKIEMLLGKGVSKLNLDEPQEAIKTFDQVLAIDSNNAEALVRKGIALERLQKLNEAIECYDRAIAANGSLTIAYLHKGGLFNRMERYEEALACYEQALRTQENSRT